MLKIVCDNEISIFYNDHYEQIAEFCDKQLTFSNPDYTKKLQYGKSTYKTPRDITLYRTSVDCFIVPYGIKKRLLDYLQTKNIAYTCEEKFKREQRDPIQYGDLPLREYQEKATNIMVEQQGGILQSKAGSGKTQIGLAITSQLGKKTLWLTHTKDLLNQSKARAEMYFDGDLIGTITEGKVNIGRGITFATVQTMVNIDLSLYKNEWDVIIVDECHRVSGSVTKVKQFQKVLENLSAPYKYGLSATPKRADGLTGTMYALIGDLIYTIPNEEVENYIMPISIKPVFTNTPLSLKECLKTDGRFDFGGAISYLTNNDERNRLIRDYLIQNRFNSNLILSDRTEHLKTLMDLLPSSFKARAVYIDGNSKKEDRENALKEMREGNKNYLFATYKLAKEGLDIPCLDRLYLATPQKDYAIIVQSIGRIARKQQGKLDPIVYDFVDAKIPYFNKFYSQRLKHYKGEGAKIL